MRSRGLVVAIAVVLAVLAAVGVIVYTSSVREKAVDENTTPVLASTQDIQANTPLDPLIAQGVFQTIQVQNTGVVPDAVTDVSQLQGQTATAPIYQNEQFPLARISRPGEHPGDRSRQHRDRARGARSSGRQRFRPAGELRDDLCDVPAGNGGRSEELQVPAGTAAAGHHEHGRIGNAKPSLCRRTSRSRSSRPWRSSLCRSPCGFLHGRTAQGASSYILNMTPEDAQELVFATGSSTLYLGLLPPDNTDGYAQPGTIGVPLGKVIGVNK